jgi:hypothetical protein
MQNIFARKDGLHNHIVNPFEQLIGLFFPHTVTQEIFQRTQTPFATEILLIIFLALHKLGVLFVDTIVREMLVFLILAVAGCLVVLFSCKSAQSFVVDVNA